MNILEKIHDIYVFDRRIQILSGQLSDLISPEAQVLDVGCGNGLLDNRIISKRPDISISGIDVLIRPETHIPVRLYDGTHFPFAEGSFDTVMFVDVLHHTNNLVCLVKEAMRVSRNNIIIKDHLLDRAFARQILRLMDDIGNVRHNVNLVYNYWNSEHWKKTFASLGLGIDVWLENLGLYPWPANLLFDKGLHFIASLAVNQED